MENFLLREERRGQVAITNLFIKVEIEHGEKESPQKLGAEICRQIMKVYGVRSAEVSNFTAAEE
jgi:hypothetical protein